MSATQLFTMRPPPEEHFHRRKSSENLDRKPSRTARFGAGPYPSGTADNHVLSLQVQNEVRTPSVPNLLNVASQKSTPTVEVHPPSYTTTSGNRGLSRPGLALSVEPNTPQHVFRDENGNIITPPSSVNWVQFKSPGWRNSDSYATEYSPLTASSGPTPTLLRKNSIDSLMRAAATIESNTDLNKVYQDKVTSIIELKNKLSEEIRGWPVSATVNQGPSVAHHYGHSTATEKQEQILLDRVSMENLSSLHQVIGSLNENVNELIDLKNHSRYIEESVAARLQQQLHIDSPRRVTLPPIESLTMNIRNEQPAVSEYRFPESNLGTPLTPTGPTLFASYSGSQPFIQSNVTSHRGGSTWPTALENQGHRATVSDPLDYKSKKSGEGTTQTAEAASKASVKTMPIFFKTPNSLSTQGKIKSKSSKKRRKSLAENTSQDYRRSLSHGLMLAETMKKNEQATTSCVHCGEGSTPEWRRGPYGNRTLCNACGLFYRKLIKKFGVKDANLLMRFKKQVNPEDRRVPSSMNVPAAFLAQLDDDSSLDAEYNTIGGSSPGISGV